MYPNIQGKSQGRLQIYSEIAKRRRRHNKSSEAPHQTDEAQVGSLELRLPDTRARRPRRRCCLAFPTALQPNDVRTEQKNDGGC